MINFDEEIKKFSPSLEVDQLEAEVINETGSDMTDALLALLDQNKQLEIRLNSQQPVNIMPVDTGVY